MFKELLLESSVEGREKIEDYRVDIMYQPPRGYYAVGKSPEIKRAISKSYFNTYDEALEHAEMEIKGWLGEL
jgi:transcriptional antiterminator